MSLLDSSETPAVCVHDVVDEVIRSRTTVREFHALPVSKSVVTDILDVARFAPSNSNTQPWSVYVLAGLEKQKLTEALMLSHERDDLPPSQHFPDELPAICRPRQADFGSRYYNAAGIDRNDAKGRYRQTCRNYQFFGAPVGLIFTIDSSLRKHSWLDFGLFLQTVMIAAKARGVDTCPQVSFVRHEPVVRAVLGFADNQSVVCGMSMGYGVREAPLNRLGMPRARVEDFVVFKGFDY